MLVMKILLFEHYKKMIWAIFKTSTFKHNGQQHLFYGVKTKIYLIK